jgi:sugar-specific transcriptional regulator TrmB
LATIIVYININEDTPNDSGRLRTSRPTGSISGKKILMSALTQEVAEVQPYDDLMDEKIRKIVWDNKIVFKNPIRISTYEDLYLIKKYDEEQIKKTFNSLFANKRTDKILQNIIDNEHNDKIIKDINNNPNHQNNMIFFDFMINICSIYSKKTELNDILLLGDADVGLVGGNVIFKTNNLLFKKDSLIKYFNNLEQLSELNDTIEKNKKIISTINSNVKYVNYFLNIINYIDNVATERTIFNVGDFIKLVAIDYDSVKRINEGLANKIFSGIDKSHYLILINSNPDCLNLITKL